MNDWLGNSLDVGNIVIYSSKSSLSGMNLGEITYVDPNKIQVKIWAITERKSGTTYVPVKIVTLQRGTSAFNSVTRYFGNIPLKEKD